MEAAELPVEPALCPAHAAFAMFDCMLVSRPFSCLPPQCSLVHALVRKLLIHLVLEKKVVTTAAAAELVRRL